MALRIPENQKNAVARLAELTVESVERLVGALRQAEPAISPRQLAVQISKSAEIGVSELTGIMALLLSLLITQGRLRRRPGTEIADEVAADAARNGLAGIQAGSKEQ